jgi:pimeloyl-ACP methyl ester carboxylesterase
MVNELEALLEAIDTEPPYVLVAHSFGGLVARLFASQYPDNVAGLVLVDPVHEDFFRDMPEGVAASRDGQLTMLTQARLASRIGLPRLLFPPLATQGLPDEAQAAANALGYRAQAYATVRAEALGFDESAEPIHGMQPLNANLPLRILSRTRPEQWPPDVDPEEAEAVWSRLQTDLAGLTNESTHVRVADSGHYIHVDQPQAVIDAILQLIR